MYPINGRRQIMEQQNNSQLPWILHHQSQRNESAGSNILLGLTTLAKQQSSPTKNKGAAITPFLDYAATNSSAIIQYKASDVILHIDSD